MPPADDGPVGGPGAGPPTPGPGGGAPPDVRRCAVLGHPIGHSLSPALHRAAYAALGLRWVYDAVDVTEAGLAGFVGGLDGSWRGLSLTMPLKRAVLPLLATVDPVARRVAAANTVVLDRDGLHGWNTDVGGLLDALAEVGVAPGAVPGRVLVLGGGATAAATVAALAELAATEVLLAVRDPARAGRVVELAERCEVPLRLIALSTVSRDPGALGTGAPGTGDAVRDVGLLVSTLPAGAADGLADAAARTLGPAGVLFDVVYDGWPTPLSRAARQRGSTVISGADLLVHQARGQVRAFTGRDVGVAVLRAALPPGLAEPPVRVGHPIRT